MFKLKFLYLIFTCCCRRIDLVTCKLILTHFDKALVNKRIFLDYILVPERVQLGMILDGSGNEFSVTKNKIFIKGHTVVIGEKTRE